jgi:hypothetical protein
LEVDPQLKLEEEKHLLRLAGRPTQHLLREKVNQSKII